MCEPPVEVVDKHLLGLPCVGCGLHCDPEDRLPRRCSYCEKFNGKTICWRCIGIQNMNGMEYNCVDCWYLPCRAMWQPRPVPRIVCRCCKRYCGRIRFTQRSGRYFNKIISAVCLSCIQRQSRVRRQLLFLFPDYILGLIHDYYQ